MQRRKETHRERERERNVLLCVRKSALLFPDQKIGLFSHFFCTSTEEEEGKERETKERRGILSLQTPLCSFVCANTTTKAPRGEEWRRQRPCCHCWRRREEKKEEKEALTEEKEDTTMGKRRERRKRGEGVFGNTNVSKKKRETHLFPKTLLTRDAHTTRRRHAYNETTRRERERETLLLLFGYTDEKPKDDDDFENTRSKV